jgi:hypothetical protein
MVNSPVLARCARRSESRFHSDFAARRGWDDWGVSKAHTAFVTSLVGGSVVWAGDLRLR